MLLQPNIKRNNEFIIKECIACRQPLTHSNFINTRSIFYHDGKLPICNYCLNNYIKENNYDWSVIDKICQWIDLPFIPREWERLQELNNNELPFEIYANIFAGEEYENIGWSHYYSQFKQLREAGLIEYELPKIREEKYKKLREKWGANYDEEELEYLEELYKGLLNSQNINGALQIDQAKKICKISNEIDSSIRSGDSKDLEKLLSSYDRLIKNAEFTPKNTKNATDFDSVAELFYWLAKRGWVNKYYDGATRDVIDETIKNIQLWNQKLYLNEGSISEEITDRIESMKNKQEIENLYELPFSTPDEYFFDSECFGDSGEEEETGE